MTKADVGFGFQTPAEFALSLGGPHVDKACFELCLPYTHMAGLNLGVQT